jgi:chaperonin GroES
MLKPLDDRVVLKVDSADDLTEGGIVIPHDAKDPVNKATVVAVGPGKYQLGTLVPCAVRVGDRVVFNHYAGQEVDGFKVVRESDIVATF